MRLTASRVASSISTRAGTFSNCVVVRNESPLPQNAGKFVTEWTYAPKVGLVQLLTSTVDAKGRQQEQTRLLLVAYHIGQ